MAVIMHYLFLCVFSWMLCEGLLIYFMLVIVFDTGKSYVKQYFALGWGNKRGLQRKISIDLSDCSQGYLLL